MQDSSRRKRLASRKAAMVALAGIVLLVSAAAALAATGDISQPAGTGGCVSETGAGTCADGHGLLRPHSVAVSPDGKSVYAAMPNSVAGRPLPEDDPGSDAVVRFNRNATTGWIAQPAGTAGCISENGTNGTCTDGIALRGVRSVAVSPDGKSVYVASGLSDAVGRFNRNTTTGAISLPAGGDGARCISDSGNGACAGGHGLATPYSVAVSPDGKSVYVASLGSDAVVRLNRNTTTGAISQPAGNAGCISQFGQGPCADGHALDGPISVAVSSDGKSVYAASIHGSDAVVRLNRNTATGAISQPAGAAGCISQTGSGPCIDGHGLLNPGSVAVSPDGKSVYAGAAAVVRLNRNTATGAIGQPAGTAGCISEDGAGPCADGHGLHNPGAVTVSPDGMNVYVASDPGNMFHGFVARLDRSTASGAISQPAGTAGCVSETGLGDCADGHGLKGPWAVAVSPDGMNVYVASDHSDAVARLNRAP